jgi:hypothetical protein
MRRATMNAADNNLALLPLLLDGTPPALEQMLRQEGVPARGVGRPGPAARFVIFDGRSGPSRPLLPGQVPIDIRRLHHGQVAEEFDALDDRDASHAARHTWDIGGLKIAEEVATVDRRAVRRRVLAALRDAIEQAGGLWLNVSAYPFPYRSLFSFRIDYDNYDAEDLANVLRAVEGQEHATTHFISGAAYDGRHDALRRFAGLDVASHAYWHHTYRTEEENYANIARGIEVLRRAGLEPSGHSAPHGRYNDGLRRAMERLGVTHSSEFALAHDDWPFVPTGGQVLQIPIHPICLGLFIDAARLADARTGAGIGEPSSRLRAVAAARRHLIAVAKNNYAAGEPIILYGHPCGRLGRHHELLGDIFQTIAQMTAVWKTTFTRLNRWWRAREAMQLVVRAEGESFAIDADGLPGGWKPTVELWRGRHVARLPLQGPSLRFQRGALAYENRASTDGLRPVRIDASHGVRGRVARWLDWEKVTPIEEIHTNTIRGKAKRLLRRLKG